MERALTLLESSINNRGEKTAASGHMFDNKPWGGITSQYAESTRKLHERKWTKIMEAVSVHLIDRSGGLSKLGVSNTTSAGRTRIVVSDEGSDEDSAP